MANREKGEIDLDIDGMTYTLAPTNDALVSAETLMSKERGEEMPISVIFLGAQRGSLSCCRALLWGMLKQHHPTITPSKTLELITSAGGIAALSDQINALMVQSSPDQKDLDALGVKVRPQKARAQKAGTGVSSISRPERTASAATSSGH